MTHSDRAFRALARNHPQVIEGLLAAVAPGLLQPGVRLAPEDLAPTQLDALPPELDADFVTRVDLDELLHIECQGYHDSKFEERTVWYHIGFALRHRGKRRVRTVAFWLIRPPKSCTGDQFRVHDIAVRVTTVVLEDVGASALLSGRRTACFAAGAALEGRTVDELCAEVVAALQADNATYAERHMAAVAAAMRGRYKEMVRAMESAHMEPVIIEDLVRFGKDLGIEEGRAEGRTEGRTEGRLAQARATLRRMLAIRGIGLSQGQEQQIDACTDIETLDRWLDHAVLARSAAEALQ